MNAQFSRHQVFIYLDGPSNSKDLKACLDTKVVALEFARQHLNVAVSANFQNSGLGEFILSTIDDVLAYNDEVVVVEDDLVLHPYFLEFCSWGLREYVRDPSVGSISGFSLPINVNSSNYFMRGADCWGWATWKDRWVDFDRNSQVLLKEIRKRRLQRVFDLDYSYQYTYMLERQAKGETNSWAIRWHAYNFLRGRLVLYPGESLVVNAGNDGSGTNMGVTDSYFTSLSTRVPSMKRIQVKEDIFARKALISYYRSVFPPSLKSRALNTFRRLVKTDIYS